MGGLTKDKLCFLISDGRGGGGLSYPKIFKLKHIVNL